MDLQQYFAEVDRAYTQLRGPQLEARLQVLCAEAGAEHGEESDVYAALSSELGGYYRGQRRFAESEAAFLRTQQILKTLLGSASPDYATALNNLAGTHRLMREFERAEAEFSEALEIYRATLGERHVLYASALNNLSLLCMDRGDLKSAAEYLRRSADILSGLPECRDELAASLCNLAALERANGRAAEAVPYLAQAIALFEHELGTDTPHYHAALTMLGLCRCDLRDPGGAREAFLQAAAAAQALYGAQHPEYLRITEYLKQAEESLS